MSNNLSILQSGLAALQQGQYVEAINLLENFCHLCEVNSQRISQEYLQAQISLVKAYHSTGKYQKAHILCQQLGENQNLQVKAWAQRILESLPPVSQVKLTPEQAAELLLAGHKALQLRRYAKAVAAFEEFFQNTDAGTQNYSQAQIWLVKAYQGNGQLEDAIALCQQLTTSEQEIVKIWATKFILTLLPEDIALQESTAYEPNQSQPTVGEAASEGIKLRTVTEFKSFCEQNLLSDLQAIEKTRQQVLNSIVFSGIILLIIISFLIRFFPFKFFDFNASYLERPSLSVVFYFLLGLFACFWIWVAFYTSATETYTSGFKSKIIQKIFDFINTNQNLNYSSYSSSADTNYTLSGFIHSQLFQALLKPNKIHQNEYIFGKVNDTLIFFSEITAEVEVKHAWAKRLDFLPSFETLDSSTHARFMFTRRTFFLMMPIYILILFIKFIKGLPYVVTRMSRGQKIDYQHFKEEVLNNQVSRKTIFKGLFFQADYNKSSTNKTLIVPNTLDVNMHILNKRQIIKLEDPEFSKFFTVYGDDQVAARYILSTNLMEKLVKFRKKAGRKLHVSFVDNMIYIAIEYAEDIFEPRLYKTMLSFSPMREYFENIQLMLGIVEDLNLNRRIWSKN
ncbi:MAG: DUF3137 domain-containing protein [Goleter apudmare HA4340-LM2]|jgi:tetratricopeptide (TPR) repeat protein|nr:DUF3137 domain-containing protein [Goleter apudmare HA4340-LM2]